MPPDDKYSKSHPRKIPEPELTNLAQANKNPRYDAKLSTTVLSENGTLYTARDISEQQADNNESDGEESDDGEIEPLLNTTTVMRLEQIPSPIFLPRPKDQSTPIYTSSEWETLTSSGSKHSMASELPDICKSAQESLFDHNITVII